MYKDKDKQREANRQAQARFKAKGITNQGITDKGITDDSLKQPSPLEVVEDFTTGGVVFDKPKRGKDIKAFADLPPDVQETIDSLSIVDGKIDKRVKANRTAIAINYQHLFPDRYEPQGLGTMAQAKRAGCRYGPVVTGKPGEADYNGVCIPEWRAERGR